MINPINTINSTLVDSFTVSIKPEKLKEMIKSHVLKELGADGTINAEVHFSVSHDYDMRGEPCGSKLSEVKVICKPIANPRY